MKAILCLGLNMKNNLANHANLRHLRVISFWATESVRTKKNQKYIILGILGRVINNTPIPTGKGRGGSRTAPTLHILSCTLGEKSHAYKLIADYLNF